MTRYFCHACKKHMTNINSDFTCPLCEKGFVEESSSDLSQEELTPGPFDFLQLFNFGVPPASSSSTSSQDYSWNFRDPHHSSGISPSSSSTTTQGYRRPFIEHSTDNMLYSFISDLVMGLGGGQHNTGFLAANFGDYVWGHDGLDALVTQLMNNMEGTGPPPLESDKITQIPNTKINQVHVDSKLQCSVCWDDFCLDEEVKQLPCEHLYHINCIIPWLKLHGTCPVCRKDLAKEYSTDTDNSSSPSSSSTESRRGASRYCEMDFD